MISPLFLFRLMTNLLYLIVLSSFMWAVDSCSYRQRSFLLVIYCFTLQGLRWKSLLTSLKISNKISPLKIFSLILWDVVYLLFPEKIFVSALDYFSAILLDFYLTTIWTFKKYCEFKFYSVFLNFYKKLFQWCALDCQTVFELLQIY